MVLQGTECWGHHSKIGKGPSVTWSQRLTASSSPLHISEILWSEIISKEARMLGFHWSVKQNEIHRGRSFSQCPRTNAQL